MENNIEDDANLQQLYFKLSANQPEEGWQAIRAMLDHAAGSRSAGLQELDSIRLRDPDWFQSEQWVGMSLFADRFAGSIQHLRDKLSYLLALGINVVHILPVLIEASARPADINGEEFKLNAGLGSLRDLRELGEDLRSTDSLLMLDVPLVKSSGEEFLPVLLRHVLFLVNCGADILRIDIPAIFGNDAAAMPSIRIHLTLQFLQACLKRVAPAACLAADGIGDPAEILEYFGSNKSAGKECRMVYAGMQAALQWDALATGDTRIMQNAQPLRLRKPEDCTWINFTRNHQAIAFTFDNAWIEQAGFEPTSHRQFLLDYYSGKYEGSPAKGVLVKNEDPNGGERICGSLSSLCGLERAIKTPHITAMDESLARITLMQAHTFLVGGIPMLYYGDEWATLNDYSYLDDPENLFDHLLMHRPNLVKIQKKGVKEKRAAEDVFEMTRKLIQLRKSLPVLRDDSNIYWVPEFNKHLAAFVRTGGESSLLVMLNYSVHTMEVPWMLVHEHIGSSLLYHEHFENKRWEMKGNEGWFQIGKYQVLVLENIRQESAPGQE